MATSQSMSLSRRITTPIKLYWQRDGNTAVPRINVDEGELHNQIFDEYDADSIEGITESVLSEYERSYLEQRRLGLVVGGNEDATFIREAEALATVEIIDDDLAAKLVDWYGDIPELCREVRRDQYLSALEGNAHAEADSEEEAAWVEDIEAGPELERRLKRAGVWTEPTDVVA